MLPIMKRALTSYDEVVAELGGVTRVAMLTGLTKAAVCNWRRKRRFPTRHYFTMARALDARGVVASRALWGFSGEELPVEDAA